MLRMKAAMAPIFSLLCVLLLACQVKAAVEERWLSVPAEHIVALASCGDQAVKAGDTHTVSLSVPEADEYHVVLSYSPVQAGLFSSIVLVEIDGVELRSALPFLWRDIPGDIRYDRYGNEILPDQELCEAVTSSYLEPYTEHAGRPYVIALTPGTHTVSVTPENYPLCLNAVAIVRGQTDVSYEEYSPSFADKPLGKDFIVIEAEDYSLKSDSFIRGTSVRNMAVSPSDPVVQRINALAHTSFNKVGQKVLYEFEVETAGLYAIAFAYSQPLKPGMPVFRTVEINGKVPFIEFRDLAFPHTGMNIYDNLVLGNNRAQREEMPYYVYLDKGTNTIAVKVTAEPIDQMYARLTEIIGEMNAATLQIKKLTGKNTDVASSMDANRTWNVLNYMPGILDDLERWQTELLGMYETLREISGAPPTFANDLVLAAQNLQRLKDDPRRLPNRIALLGDDASSAAQLLGSLLPKLSEQNMSIDRIYIYDGVAELPSPKESLWARFAAGIKQFLHSFTPVMNETAKRGDGGRLTVWVNKSSQYVEVLRELTATSLTPQTGIEVTFSIMPKEDKLILANASGTNPDVVVGIAAHYPFDFGVRGLAKNLLEYEDFISWYSKEYNLESLVPMAFNGGIYGACDTHEFRVLFYRKDILEMLGLSVPQTMDDVRAMIPTLHRNAMSFSIPLSTNMEGYKGFQQTMPFVYQNGGDIYSADGMSATLTDPRTVKGLREMCDLYRVYGLPINVRNFFNSFRSGVIPLGISDFATYLLLQTTAPELADLWDIALAPGVRSEDGTILRYQAAADTATMILSNTNMPDEAYAFLKWWLSSETQVRFATELQRKYGPEYKWNTANLVAFDQMGYPEKHKQVILSMWRDWQKETPRHIAGYMMEREISNLWGSVVRDGEPFMPTLDQAEMAVNREMLRKLYEFGFVDANGNMIRPYNNRTVEDLKAALQREEAAQ